MSIEVQPGAQRQGLVGFNAWRGRISLAVRAPAKDGQANAAVLHVLANQFGLPLTHLSIINGHSSRQKTIRFSDVSSDKILGKLQHLLGDLP